MRLSESDIKRLAETRVAFKQHLISFVVIIPALFILDYVTSGRILWAYWPLLGWGIGLAIHGFHAYGPFIFSVENEEDKIRRKMGR